MCTLSHRIEIRTTFINCVVNGVRPDCMYTVHPLQENITAKIMMPRTISGKNIRFSKFIEIIWQIMMRKRESECVNIHRNPYNNDVYARRLTST